jgi:hypothetical protein
MTEYLNASICADGHFDTADVSHTITSPFCEKCGEPTSTTCDICEAPYRGGSRGGGFTVIGTAQPYCYNCGNGYSWTQRKLAGIEELAEAIGDLTDHERDTLHELMPHLLQETSRTPVAGFKIAALVQKVRGPAKALLHDAIISAAVEMGKKAFGS